VAFLADLDPFEDIQHQAFSYLLNHSLFTSSSRIGLQRVSRRRYQTVLKDSRSIRQVPEQPVRTFSTRARHLLHTPVRCRGVTLLSWLTSPTDGFANHAEIACDVLLFLFTAITLVFIAVEYAAEHWNWTWGEEHERVFAMLVVAGLAGELIFEIGSFRLFVRLTGVPGKATVCGSWHRTEAKTNALAALTNAAQAER